MISREDLLSRFALLSGGTGGIDNWIASDTQDRVIDRLCRIDDEPIPRTQLNQLLLLSHEAGVSDGFFRYYWLTDPDDHPYDVRSIEGFKEEFLGSEHVISVDHLRWGLYRLYVDALLYFGNIRSAYRNLRDLEFAALHDFFHRRCYRTRAMAARGPALPLNRFAKDDRYLVSEMACKSYDSIPGEASVLRDALLEAWKDHAEGGGGKASIRQLLEGTYAQKRYADRQVELVFSADDILEDDVTSVDDIERKYDAVAQKFTAARDAALENTRLYLSMVNELDVYVATSMRTRGDFRQMADRCDKIFEDQRLADLQIRYFDPTLSAADGHEDKGLIECLMVKSAKMLVYSAGQKESYGKDAEAAMALSLGKPVVFLCDEEQRSRFYRDVHPLSRLIDFSTGVAVGAMVTDSVDDVVELVSRTFRNEMQYELEQPKPGYFQLKEVLTNSVVRLQTSDALLRETFWNYYHSSGPISRKAGAPSYDS